MTAEKDFPCDLLAHCFDRVAKSSAVAFGLAGKGRAKALRPPIGQIAAQNGIALSGKDLGERDEQRSVAITARAMGKDESVPIWRHGRMKEATDGRVERAVKE